MTLNTQEFRMHLRVKHGDHLWCGYGCNFTYPAAASYLYRRHIEQCHNRIFKEGLSSKPENLSKEPELDVNGNIVTKKSGNDSGKGQDVLTQEKPEKSIIENILDELLPPGCLGPIPLTPPRKRESEGVEKDICQPSKSLCAKSTVTSDSSSIITTSVPSKVKLKKRKISQPCEPSATISPSTSLSSPQPLQPASSSMKPSATISSDASHSSQPLQVIPSAPLKAKLKKKVNQPSQSPAIMPSVTSHASPASVRPQAVMHPIQPVSSASLKSPATFPSASSHSSQQPLQPTSPAPLKEKFKKRKISQPSKLASHSIPQLSEVEFQQPTSPPPLTERTKKAGKLVPAQVAAVSQWPAPVPDTVRIIDARYNGQIPYKLVKISLSSVSIHPRGRDPRVDGLILKRRL